MSEKFNRYTTQLAREEYDKGKRITASNFVLNFLIRPLYLFFRKYVIMRGYKDGFRGFFISFSSALTIFVMYSKLWELQELRWRREKYVLSRHSKVCQSLISLLWQCSLLVVCSLSQFFYRDEIWLSIDILW